MKAENVYMCPICHGQGKATYRMIMEFIKKEIESYKKKKEPNK